MRFGTSGSLLKGNASRGRQLAGQIKLDRRRLRPYLAKLKTGQALSLEEEEQVSLLERQIKEAKNALEGLGFNVEKSVMLASTRDAKRRPESKKKRESGTKAPTYAPKVNKNARWKKGKKRYKPDPLPETPKSFSKDELRKIDWSST